MSEYKTCPICDGLISKIHCGYCGQSYWQTEKHDCSAMIFTTSTGTGGKND